MYYSDFLYKFDKVCYSTSVDARKPSCLQIDNEDYYLPVAGNSEY